MADDLLTRGNSSSLAGGDVHLNGHNDHSSENVVQTGDTFDQSPPSSSVIKHCSTAKSGGSTPRLVIDYSNSISSPVHDPDEGLIVSVAVVNANTPNDTVSEHSLFIETNDDERPLKSLHPSFIETRKKSNQKDISLQQKYATMDYRRHPTVKSDIPPIPLSSPFLTTSLFIRRRSYDDLASANLTRESFQLDLNHNLREIDEALKKAEAMEKSIVNDDANYPDAVTPSKVDQSLVNQSYDVPFIDDAAFFCNDWYVMEGQCWSQLDGKMENAPSQKKTDEPLEKKEEIVVRKIEPVKSAPPSSQNKPRPMAQVTEQPTKSNKPKGVSRLCGCMGSK